MKKVLCLLLAVVMLGCFSGCGENDSVDRTRSKKLSFKGNLTDSMSEDEDREDFIEIDSVDDLKNIVDDLGGKYILTQDIDMSSCNNWTPLGSRSEPFTGTLDGNGYCIKNLKSNITYSKNMEGAGLFLMVRGATFKNLGIKGGKIHVNSNEMGAKAGAFACIATPSRKDDVYVPTTLTNCFVDVEVSSNDTTPNRGLGSNAMMSIGSFFGYGCADFENCYSVGLVNSTKGYADQYVGGFIGEVPASEVTGSVSIINCYSLCNFDVGNVRGDLAGFLGEGFSKTNEFITIKDSYYCKNYNSMDYARKAVSGEKDKNFDGVTGLDVEEMTNKEKFKGFDFENIWNVSSDINNGYPYLRVQKN